MAKRYNKLAARVAALESRVIEMFSGKKATRKKAAAKKKRKAAKKKRKAAKKKTATKRVKKASRKKVKARAAAKKPVRKIAKAPAHTAKRPSAKKAAPVSRGVGTQKTARKAQVRRSLPTIEQLAPSGAPEFVTPLDQV